MRWQCAGRPAKCRGEEKKGSERELRELSHGIAGPEGNVATALPAASAIPDPAGLELPALPAHTRSTAGRSRSLTGGSIPVIKAQVNERR